MIVVSDTSPLIAIAHLELPIVLERLFTSVLIPPAVHAEFLRFDSERFRTVMSDWAFISIASPRDQQTVERLSRQLDPGESEALALAIEVQPDAVLVDETLGRRVALSLGLPVVGTLGVLLRAKAAKLVTGVGPLMVRLRTELQFRISDPLARDVLRRAGEIESK